MNKFVGVLAALVLGVTAWAVDAETIYRQASPAVMTVYVKDKSGDVVGNGTAFMISADGLAVTAYHVIAEAERASVKFVDGTSADVIGVVDANKEHDVAIVRVNAKLRATLPLASDLPGVGAPAFVIGAPKGLEFSISEGIVNRFGTDSGVRVIQFSAPVSPGNSGSPLIDRYGRAVGVVSFQRNDGQNLNFAVPNQYVRDLNRTLAVRSLPVQSSTVRLTSSKVDWKTYDFVKSGFQVQLPGAPVMSKDVIAELVEDTKSQSSATVETPEGPISLNYFDFKDGRCPRTIDVAREVKKRRSKDAIVLENKKIENPSLMEFAAKGADEGHAVLVSFMDDDAPVVECTAVVRKGQRLFVVTITYDARSEGGLEQLEKILDSVQFKS